MISVIIPSYRRDPDDLRAFMTHLLGLATDVDYADAVEILLSDLGTPDVDRLVADAVAASGFRGRCQVLHHPERTTLPRYTSMNLAAADARGDVLLFLHADLRLPPNAFRGIAAAMRGDVVGGGFLKRYDIAPPLLRASQVWINCSAQRGGHMVGTNAIFIRTSVFRELGGFREHFLEDVVLSDQLLARYGRQRLGIIPDRVLVSAEKYRRDGVLKSILVNLAIVRAWATGVVAPERLEAIYRTKQDRSILDLLRDIQRARRDGIARRRSGGNGNEPPTSTASR